MKMRRIGGDIEVSAVGLGCMGMSFAYGGQDAADATRTLHRAVELGVNFFDTAEVYGPFENEKLVGAALKPFRDRVVIATKFGFRIKQDAGAAAQVSGVDGSAKNVVAVCEASLKRLGVDAIDLYYQHRVDPEVPIEETIGAMADLVRQGKVRALGLSEAAPATLRRAHAVHPIAALQTEYSLWSREPEREIIPTCRELGITFVPYSPLGRGFLTGSFSTIDALGESDWRRNMPRFQGENFSKNLSLVETLQRVAGERGLTAAQVAIAWMLNRDETLVPIPGARRIKHLEENVAAADIVLTPADIAAIEAAIPQSAVAGERYAEAGRSLLNR